MTSPHFLGVLGEDERAGREEGTFFIVNRARRGRKAARRPHAHDDSRDFFLGFSYSVVCRSATRVRRANRALFLFKFVDGCRNRP